MPRQRGRWPDEGTQFEEGPVLLERLGQLGRLVRRPEPAPGDQVGVRRDGGRRIYLQQGEAVHHVHQVCRPGGVEQLRSHGDLPRFLAAQPAYAHGARP
jgi:hypothetical protein